MLSSGDFIPPIKKLLLYTLNKARVLVVERRVLLAAWDRILHLRRRALLAKLPRQVLELGKGLLAQPTGLRFDDWFLFFLLDTFAKSPPLKSTFTRYASSSLCGVSSLASLPLDLLRVEVGLDDVRVLVELVLQEAEALDQL